MLNLGAALSAGSYLLGIASLGIAVTSLSWGSWRLRGRLLPDWSGPPARLAEIVVVIAIAIGWSQLLGSLGGFEPTPVFVSLTASGLALGALARPHPSRAAKAHDTASVRQSVRQQELAAAFVAGAIVLAQWAAHVGFAFGNGMTEGDTLWYHAPFTARFVQTGFLTRWSETGLTGLGTPLHSYLPLNSEVVHGLLILPFGRDLLSPLVNVGWAAVALLGAWCLGRRHGVGLLCVLGALAVLGLPTIVGTEPGQGTNNVAVGALFLAAVALLLEGRLATIPTALAGIAAGLALGTKLTVAAPIAVLTIGIVALSLRARRWTAAVAWCVALAVSGGYWFVRNWAASGNPLPFFGFDVGPFSFERVFERRPSILDAAQYGWRRFYLPGLEEAWGRVWPLVALLMLSVLVLAVVRGRALERLVGVALLVGLVAYVQIPGTAEFGGASFVFTLRYLTFTVLVAFAFLARGIASTPIVRTVVAAAFVLIVVLNATTARMFDETKLWPSSDVLVGVLAGAVVVAGALAFPRLREHTAGEGRVALVALVLVLLLGGGWALQRRFLDQRYVNAGLALDAAYASLRDLHGERIAVFGNQQLYGLFGTDLSNEPAKVRGPKRGSSVSRCRRWRQILSDGDYRYVVLDQQLFSDRGPAEEWIASDPAATRVLRDGTSVVYRVNGLLDPETCS